MSKSHLQATILVAMLGILSCAGRQPPDDTTELVGSGEPRVATDDTSFDRRTLWYRIALADEALDVRVRLISPPDVTKFFLPGQWGGIDFSDRIRIAGAHGPNGPRFLTIDRRRGRIDVESKDSEWVELRYRVDLERSASVPLAPRYSDGVLSAYGPTVLVLPAKQILDRTRDIPVEVNLPRDWSVLSTWPNVYQAPSKRTRGNMVYGFIATDSQVLRDAFLVAGRELEIVHRGSSQSVSVGFDPTFTGDRSAIADLVHEVVRRFRASYGDLGPTRVYIDARRGEANESTGGLGRSGGFVLELPSNAMLTPATVLIAAHEALHLWNGHHLVPESSDEATLRWFKEGVTHYLAIKAACETQQFGMQDALAELARVADNYERNPVTSGERAQKVDELRFPYDFGVLFALSADTFLMARNRGSLGDWLPALEESIQNRERNSYDEATLLESFSTLIDGDPRLAELWRDHVRQQKPFAVNEVFSRIGLHFLKADRSRDAKLIALDRPSPQYEALLETCKAE